ncbi:hypothetical protein HDU76_005937 [Blyttiomyces sp. JEL0837]|nr:hypothetical protein HDU76_005937 [Blyttiomyces sp. JEL0837]
MDDSQQQVFVLIAAIVSCGIAAVVVFPHIVPYIRPTKRGKRAHAHETPTFTASSNSKQALQELLQSESANTGGNTRGSVGKSSGKNLSGSISSRKEKGSHHQQTTTAGSINTPPALARTASASSASSAASNLSRPKSPEGQEGTTKSSNRSHLIEEEPLDDLIMLQQASLRQKVKKPAASVLPPKAPSGKKQKAVLAKEEEDDLEVEKPKEKEVSGEVPSSSVAAFIPPASVTANAKSLSSHQSETSVPALQKPVVAAAAENRKPAASPKRVEDESAKNIKMKSVVEAAAVAVAVAEGSPRGVAEKDRHGRKGGKNPSPIRNGDAAPAADAEHMTLADVAANEDPKHHRMHQHAPPRHDHHHPHPHHHPYHNHNAHSAASHINEQPKEMPTQQQQAQSDAVNAANAATAAAAAASSKLIVELQSRLAIAESTLQSTQQKSNQLESTVKELQTQLVAAEHKREELANSNRLLAQYAQQSTARADASAREISDTRNMAERFAAEVRDLRAALDATENDAVHARDALNATEAKYREERNRHSKEVSAVQERLVSVATVAEEKVSQVVREADEKIMRVTRECELRIVEAVQRAKREWESEALVRERKVSRENGELERKVLEGEEVRRRERAVSASAVEKKLAEATENLEKVKKENDASSKAQRERAVEASEAIAGQTAVIGWLGRAVEESKAQAQTVVTKVVEKVVEKVAAPSVVSAPVATSHDSAAVRRLTMELANSKSIRGMEARISALQGKMIVERDAEIEKLKAQLEKKGGTVAAPVPVKAVTEKAVASVSSAPAGMKGPAVAMLAASKLPAAGSTGAKAVTVEKETATTKTVTLEKETATVEAKSGAASTVTVGGGFSEFEVVTGLKFVISSLAAEVEGLRLAEEGRVAKGKVASVSVPVVKEEVPAAVVKSAGVDSVLSYEAVAGLQSVITSLSVRLEDLNLSTGSSAAGKGDVVVKEVIREVIKEVVKEVKVAAKSNVVHAPVAVPEGHVLPESGNVAGPAVALRALAMGSAAGVAGIVPKAIAPVAVAPSTAAASESAHLREVVAGQNSVISSLAGQMEGTMAALETAKAVKAVAPAPVVAQPAVAATQAPVVTKTVTVVEPVAYEVAAAYQKTVASFAVALEGAQLSKASEGSLTPAVTTPVAKAPVAAVKTVTVSEPIAYEVAAAYQQTVASFAVALEDGYLSSKASPTSQSTSATVSAPVVIGGDAEKMIAAARTVLAAGPSLPGWLAPGKHAVSEAVRRLEKDKEAVGAWRGQNWKVEI